MAELMRSLGPSLLMLLGFAYMAWQIKQLTRKVDGFTAMHHACQKELPEKYALRAENRDDHKIFYDRIEGTEKEIEAEKNYRKGVQNGGAVRVTG